MSIFKYRHLFMNLGVNLIFIVTISFIINNIYYRIKNDETMWLTANNNVKELQSLLETNINQKFNNLENNFTHAQLAAQKEISLLTQENKSSLNALNAKKEEWLLPSLISLVSKASQELTLFHNVHLAYSLLTRVHENLAVELPHDEYTTLKDAVAKDIKYLDNILQFNQEAIKNIAAVAEQLSVKAPELTVSAAKMPSIEPQENLAFPSESWWQKSFSVFTNNIKNSINLAKISDPNPMLLPQLLKEEVMTSILNNLRLAQLDLELFEYHNYETHLNNALNYLQKYHVASYKLQQELINTLKTTTPDLQNFNLLSFNVAQEISK